MPRRRVVVTGVGFVSPHGDHASTVFDRVYAGESVVRFRRFGDGAMTFALPVAQPEWTPAKDEPALPPPLTDAVAHMAFLAALRAITEAGLSESPEALARAGVYLGCSQGGARSSDESHAKYADLASGGRGRIRAATVPRVMPNAPAAHISMAFGIRGPSNTFSMACASSATAIGEAFRVIRDGYLDCVVAGGAEAMLSDRTLASWEALGALATPHPGGGSASVRPFDRARTGFAIGEGAAILVLEALEAAVARGAPLLGEVVGYGASSDAFSLTEPSPEGQAAAMRACLADAGLYPTAVGYINAHATGTPNGDIAEVRAITEVFGPHAQNLKVSSTKAVHGHLIGAAGALELAITLLGLRTGRIPPTANLEDPDPECDLDCVPLRGREVPDLEFALSNSFGFGGNNVSLIVRRLPV